MRLTYSTDSTVLCLNIRVRLVNREEGLVEDLLSQVSCLVVLKLHTVCTDQMLAIISRTCPRLAVLDVSFSRNVSDSGIEILCRYGWKLAAFKFNIATN